MVLVILNCQLLTLGVNKTFRFLSLLLYQVLISIIPTGTRQQCFWTSPNEIHYSRSQVHTFFPWLFPQVSWGCHWQTRWFALIWNRPFNSGCPSCRIPIVFLVTVGFEPATFEWHAGTPTTTSRWPPTRYTHVTYNLWTIIQAAHTLNHNSH